METEYPLGIIPVEQHVILSVESFLKFRVR